MSVTNPNLPVTEARLQEFYERIKPYLGGGYSAGDGIEISNGEISTDNLQSGDMDDVVTPLPAVTTRKEFIKYSTDEQIVGEWIDGKPLYQKTITKTISASSKIDSTQNNFYQGQLSLSSEIPNIEMAMVDIANSYYRVGTGTSTRGFISSWYEADTGNIWFSTLYERTNVSATFTVKYTKTTD